MSLAARFNIFIVVTALATAIVFIGLSSYWTWSKEREQAALSMRTTLETVGPQLASAIWALDRQAIDAQLISVGGLPAAGAVWLENTEFPDGTFTRPRPEAPVGPIVSVPLEHAPRQGELVRLGTIAVELRFDEIDRRALNGLVKEATAIIALLVILVITVRLVFRRLVTLPLDEVSRFMSRGDLLTSEARLAIPGPSQQSADELGRLESAINQMLQERRRDLTELNAYRDNLENLVEDRTEQLSAANTELVEALETLKRAQDELVRSENLAALGSMVAGIAHELNTPIGNGLVAASTIQERTEDVSTRLKAKQIRKSELDGFMDETSEASAIIVATLRRARDLVQNFKQVAVDRSSAQRRSFGLREVIEETLGTLQPTLRKLPFKIETSIDTDVTMNSYPGPLGQILTNLVENAVKHGFDGRDSGIITIETEILDGSVSIQVHDNGNGMPPAHIKRIFDPFFTTKLGKGGSGLGMSIVHRIATEVLGGRIDIQSAMGEGTTVSIILPLTAPERAAGHADAKAQAA